MFSRLLSDIQLHQLRFVGERSTDHCILAPYYINDALQSLISNLQACTNANSYIRFPSPTDKCHWHYPNLFSASTYHQDELVRLLPI